MPDAHSGYGLPIGGRTGGRECSHSLWASAWTLVVVCVSVSWIYLFPYLAGARDKYEKALVEHTKFGMYETHKSHVEHEIFDPRYFFPDPYSQAIEG